MLPGPFKCSQENLNMQERYSFWKAKSTSHPRDLLIQTPGFQENWRESYQESSTAPAFLFSLNVYGAIGKQCWALGGSRL
jgi:hypothetical protein